ncbi:MAG: hypothetical protein IJ109_07505 [Firmicutes bacterium]|nr:hypothetical protein [Bacillota bacterium]
MAALFLRKVTRSGGSRRNAKSDAPGGKLFSAKQWGNRLFFAETRRSLLSMATLFLRKVTRSGGFRRNVKSDAPGGKLFSANQWENRLFFAETRRLLL